MAAEGYGDNNGFRNLAELQQFLWLQKHLSKDTKICHNFYLFDERRMSDREVDIGVLTDRLLLLIEHKCGFRRAYDARKGIRDIHIPTGNFLDQKNCREKPWTNGIIISRQPQFPAKKEELKKEKIYSVTNEEDTKEFINKDFKKFEDPIPRNWPRISALGRERIMTAFDCEKYRFTSMKRNIFEVFDEIQKKPLSTEGKFIGLTPDDRNQRVSLLYKTFAPVNYILSKVFLELDKERAEKLAPAAVPIFNFHRASSKHLAKLRPTYWVSAISSEDEDEAKHIQLGFHISKGPWYSTEKEAKPENHIAIKLAFFRDLNPDSLELLKEKLDKERETFKQLLFELAEKDLDFEFFVSEGDRHERRKIKDYCSRADEIADSIIRYDLDVDGVKQPRSNEIVKWILGDEKVETIFQNEGSAIEFLKNEFKKLLRLYYFMTDQSG